MHQSTSRPRPVVGWDEEDIYTAWRHMYCYTKRAGVIKKIKHFTHKRERREARAEINRDLAEHLTDLEDSDG